jgi:hypothetical protein
LFVIAWSVILAESFTEGVRVSPEIVTLKSGQYVWEPERAPEGPLLIVASITDQIAYVYRNGICIARSSVSTGRTGHPTPTGVFTILEKEVHHTSSIYKGAEMPYMERVTWGGIALHAGDLPGYPDSHGCVRLPLEFSKLLFGVTMKGATVIIADAHSAPATTVHPGLFFAQSGQESEPIAAGKFDWDPDKSPTGPVSVIVSNVDKTVYIYRNGVEIGRTFFWRRRRAGCRLRFWTKQRQSSLRGRRLCLLTDLWIRLRKALRTFKFSSRKKTSLLAEPNETRYDRGGLKRLPGFLQAVRVS